MSAQLKFGIDRNLWIAVALVRGYKSFKFIIGFATISAAFEISL